ncbi:hypothetical protein [Priestia koreensis]|uniref:hypothetical protein n=1 Tax=Priestia koreensis TaxID=284581 RepID=UPI00203CA06F|nr:hypothetical protein [Priestia koreensis]MCM3006323.1 hypothetical protein [Priestia koreensis]
MIELIENLIINADEKHQLKQAYLNKHRYYTDFIDAMAELKENLTNKEFENFLKKFQFNKDYDRQRYLQTVSEVNVLYYVLRVHNNSFRYEPKYNKGYNPECSFEYRHKSMNIEVKCPNMEKRIAAEERDTLKIFSAERVPDYKSNVNDILELIGSNIENNGYSGLEELFRMDNKLKDFLKSAQDKFPISTNLNFNILAISLEIISDMDEWYSYIFGENGVFTQRSFVEEEYGNVDAILITTPACGHAGWCCYGEVNVWKLEETMSLLFLNPNREHTETGIFYITNGIELLGNLTGEFLSFQMKFLPHVE